MIFNGRTFTLIVAALIGTAFVLTAPNNPNLHAGQPTPFDHALIISGADMDHIRQVREFCRTHGWHVLPHGLECY